MYALILLYVTHQNGIHAVLAGAVLEHGDNYMTLRVTVDNLF